MPKIIEQTHKRVEFGEDEIKDLIFAEASKHLEGAISPDELSMHATILRNEGGADKLQVTVCYNRKTPN